jgi:hypothetical protein
MTRRNWDDDEALLSDLAEAVKDTAALSPRNGGAPAGTIDTGRPERSGERRADARGGHAPGSRSGIRVHVLGRRPDVSGL